MPALAKLVQNVWRRVWGVITLGKASSWHLLYFFASWIYVNTLDKKAERLCCFFKFPHPPFVGVSYNQ